jgi:hypothetical protein
MCLSGVSANNIICVSAETFFLSLKIFKKIALARKLGALGAQLRNTWNSVPNHSAEEKTTQNSVPWNKNTCKSKLSGEFRSFCSEAVSDENILFAGAGFFVR